MKDDRRGHSCRWELLRNYECYCYQAAYYLLGNEEDAMAATKSALIDVAADHEFAGLPVARQRELVRRTTMTHSLHILKKMVLAV